MEKKLQFSTLPGGSGEVANVFVHGYSAGHNLEDRRLLAKYVPPSLNNCVNIFAFWPSSHFGRNIGFSKAVYGATRAPALFAGPGGLLITGAAFIGDRGAHFLRIRARAEKIGSVLLSEINDYILKTNPRIVEINLIGHSLGGRVIVNSLKKTVNDNFGLKVIDVLLMAAAVEVSEDEEKYILSHVNGRVINAYSGDDYVLKLNVGEKCLGESKAKYFENFLMSGFGHSDYWRELSYVMKTVYFGNFQGNQISAVVGSTSSSENDWVRQDECLYQVMLQSPSICTEEALKHLKTSTFVTVLDEEADRAYALTRELRSLGGSFLANVLRGQGLRYEGVLAAVADKFGVSSKLRHRCSKLVEFEELLIREIYIKLFSERHPMANSPYLCARNLSREIYFAHVDALAEQLTIASYWSSSKLNVDMSDPAAGKSIGSSVLLVRKRVSRLRWLSTRFTNLTASIMPGYSALIPAIAIVFYSRVNLHDERLM